MYTCNNESYFSQQQRHYTADAQLRKVKAGKDFILSWFCTVLYLDWTKYSSVPSCPASRPAPLSPTWSFILTVSIMEAVGNLTLDSELVYAERTRWPGERRQTRRILLRVGHVSLFQNPTQPTKVFTRPNPTHHRHLVWHIRLYRKLYTTTDCYTSQTSSQFAARMKVRGFPHSLYP